MKSEEFNSSSAIYTTHKRNRKHSYLEQQALCGLLLFCSPHRKTDNKDNRLSIENCDYAEILRHAVIVMDYTYNLISIHIYLLILNSNHAANIRLLFFISKHSCLKVQTVIITT